MTKLDTKQIYKAYYKYARAHREMGAQIFNLTHEIPTDENLTYKHLAAYYQAKHLAAMEMAWNAKDDAHDKD